MSAALLADVGTVPAPPGLVVLAHATPDIDPRMSPGGYLTETVPGNPLVFAVSEQGRVAPFTALRIAGALADSTPSLGDVVVVVLDQGAMPWDVPDLDLVPAIDAGVALHLRRAARPAVRIQEHLDVPPERVGAVLAGALPDRIGSLLVGPGVPAGQRARLRRPVVEVPPGRVCTATWQLLVPARERQALVEYDAAIRHLAIAVIDPPEEGSGDG
jgi:hypothetical protein